MKNFLEAFPPIDIMNKEMKGVSFPEYREVNGHIHTPYSFSAFNALNTAFKMASDENISVLGINDFYVTDGYEMFHQGCMMNKIFPLFNIEFIGLLKEEQKNGLRINDPNNPGRIYFSGKGLDYPSQAGWQQKRQLRNLKKESQAQIRAMIDKLNGLLANEKTELKLTYDEIRNGYAKELVRERHLARALRELVARTYSDEESRLLIFEKLYGGKKPKASFSNHAALENEIRSNLLKSGGAAFVEEDEKSFLELTKIIKLIMKYGGIPCYPVLLDDPSGRFTEFESDPVKLYNSLDKMGIECIEFIPGRNDHAILKRYVEYFNDRGFIITFGTEHNTPEMIPVTVTARGGIPLDETLKKIAWEGACVIAAHQYLRAVGRQGYVLPDGSHSLRQMQELKNLGQLVIEYYLNKYENEGGN